MIVAGEIIKIHTYLFTAPRLRFMAGGSLLLETYATFLIPRLASKLDPKSNVHLAAAGRFMVEFADKTRADQFKRLARAAGAYLFGEENTLVCGPFSKNGPFDGGKGIIDVVRDTLEDMKMGRIKRPYSAISSLQYMERCSACGAWGASESRSVKKDEDKPSHLCRICALKLDARNRRRINIPFFGGPSVDGFKGIRIDDEKTEGESLFVPYPEYEQNKKIKDFKDIAQKSSPPYIGIFYADGNEMGDLIHKRKNVEEYSETSTKIQEENKKALEEAAKKVSDDDGFPGLVLIKGGDDLLAVLPADKSLEFARLFLEKTSKPESAYKNGICGGLVLSRPNIPFSILYEKADELVTNAKRQVWRLKKDTSNEISTPAGMSAIDFMLVTTPMIDQLDRKAERRIYQMEADAYKFTMFTARPYMLEEYRQLIETIRKLKKIQVPRRLFMDLKDIFHPPLSANSSIEEARVDKNGAFIGLKELITRLCSLRRNEGKKIMEFFNSNILHNNYAEWKYPDEGGVERKAIRRWQADLIEIADFIK
jgi:hypothetical protein